SEALHGVAREGVTEFPEPIGLAATFDPAGIHEMATVIGVEGRVKNALAVKANGGHSEIFEGLDFWAPNINIFRDPRWGRGQETYGEDPFLTAQMGVAFVTGMQGDDPRYYRAISTPKHYAVHSGPESTRHTADVIVSKHDELDTYLPAFRAAITEGRADSVMCAYNSINGQPACANEFLLQDQLRNKWAFKGYVVSDCGAVGDIFYNHHYEPAQSQASAISLKRGMDNECVDFTFKVKDDHDYKPYLDAVKEGYLKESDIDKAVVLAWARMGWAKFQRGENLAAMQFLTSACLLSQSGTVANRLGQVLEKQGQPEKARHIYALAVAAGGSANEVQDSRARLAKLAGDPAGAEKDIALAPTELVQARTVKLGILCCQPASGRFTLVFDSSPRPERAEFVDGDESLRSARQQLREKDFPVRFPDVSSVKVVRRGLLSCGERL